MSIDKSIMNITSLRYIFYAPNEEICDVCGVVVSDYRLFLTRKWLRVCVECYHSSRPMQLFDTVYKRIYYNNVYIYF